MTTGTCDLATMRQKRREARAKHDDTGTRKGGCDLLLGDPAALSRRDGVLLVDNTSKGSADHRAFDFEILMLMNDVR